MSVQETLDAILAEMTPEHLCGVVQRIAASQATADRATVSLTALTQALVQGRDLGSGSEAWSAQVKLKWAIRDTLLSVPRMRFVEGDS